MQIVNDQYQAYVPKNDPELPNNYQITVELRNGAKKSFEVVRHSINHNLNVLQIDTREDEIKLIPMDVIAEIAFDKRWMKIIDIHKKKMELQKATQDLASKCKEATPNA